MDRKRIVVMGFMGGCPIAGVVWQHIHYVVGLQRLGHDVYYIEDSARFPYNPVTFEQSEDYRHAAATLEKLAAEYGFRDRWAYCPRYLPGDESAGLSRSRIGELYREADVILNVCGSQELNEDLLVSDRLAYIESDPAVEQIKIDNGDAAAREYLGRHRWLFTFGENVGTPSFPVPPHDFKWLPTRQPVVTALWNDGSSPPPGAVFASIANWTTGGRKDIQWRGSVYLWSKSIEFLKFVDAPARCGEVFELATDFKDRPTAELFQRNGWRQASPYEISIDFEAYRRYIQASKGEFTAAKDQYVRLNTGWFSDRSACYLAAGRPVITQQTGFTSFYGGKRGLFAFASLEEIQEAVREINADFSTHSRAALEIAQEYFEAEKVLADLLARTGV